MYPLNDAEASPVPVIQAKFLYNLHGLAQVPRFWYKYDNAYYGPLIAYAMEFQRAT